MPGFLPREAGCLFCDTIVLVRRSRVATQCIIRLRCPSVYRWIELNTECEHGRAGCIEKAYGALVLRRRFDGWGREHSNLRQWPGVQLDFHQCAMGARSLGQF